MRLTVPPAPAIRAVAALSACIGGLGDLLPGITGERQCTFECGGAGDGEADVAAEYTEIRAELVRGAKGDLPPLPEDENAVADLLDLIEVVRGEEGGPVLLVPGSPSPVLFYFIPDLGNINPRFLQRHLLHSFRRFCPRPSRGLYLCARRRKPYKILIPFLDTIICYLYLAAIFSIPISGIKPTELKLIKFQQLFICIAIIPL